MLRAQFEQLQRARASRGQGLRNESDHQVDEALRVEIESAMIEENVSGIVLDSWPELTAARHRAVSALLRARKQLRCARCGNALSLEDLDESNIVLHMGESGDERLAHTVCRPPRPGHEEELG